MTMSDDDLFSKYGLSIQSGQVEVGKTYPIYGMITNILDETLGSIVVEINFNITARLNVHESEKLELIKERTFEPGIFISTVSSVEPTIVVECNTVVFGKRQSTEIQ